ncbi:hypothetical protein SAY86_008545 [Trapa natans]|uniref:Transcription factor MYC/MYB N-terminal domain-containing protein n=1 Tax=Trapa natans TaxID=22666 RepID=A0AAN7KAC8_TRANT|nr:hypothetical protein SAY86_008545 [Trapa natans]
METLSGSTQSSGGSCQETTHLPIGKANVLMKGQEETGGIVWEDGFCNFAASTAVEPGECQEGSLAYPFQGLQPELFFKMSHEIYHYGEGLIGKVAADYSHKWVHRESNDQEMNFLSSSSWRNSADSNPRTWEAQFQSGIKTISLIAVREGVLQLGSLHKVMEDLNHVVLLRKRFSYIESIPGVLLPHPSSSLYPYKIDGSSAGPPPADSWHLQVAALPPVAADHSQFYSPATFGVHQTPPMMITPSMRSLEALLSKLPSVVPPPRYSSDDQHQCGAPARAGPMEFMGMAKEEMAEDRRQGSGTFTSARGQLHRHHHNSHHYQDSNGSSSSTTSNGL